jgi:hypothetical protein
MKILFLVHIASILPACCIGGCRFHLGPNFGTYTSRLQPLKLRKALGVGPLPTHTSYADGYVPSSCWLIEAEMHIDLITCRSLI